ncbi:MAG TPA: cell division protein FtsA [Bryobacteraceae bacterium]|nr:cell division protein FtsA [Bryobacteraceae bacterium]
MSSSNMTIGVGLDAGSGHTRCVAVRLENSRLFYLGHGDVDSLGWSKGRIADPQALSVCIQAAVRHAEEEGKTPVGSVTCGIGWGIQSFDNRGTYEFARPHQINPGDMSYAIERATDVHLETDRCLLQMFPQDFTIDGRAFHRNPKGAICTRLDANVHILTALRQEHDTLVHAIHQAHFAVEETVCEGIAASYAAVMPEDRLRGVALLDIGMESSNLIVYEGDALLLARSLPIGSDHMTRDAAYGLKVSYADAERLKVEYGCALLGLTGDNSLIDLPSAEGRPARETARKQLNQILEARAEELFHFARTEIAAIGKDQGLLEGIVLTGGGAMLSGMCDLAERVLNCQARNGLPLGIEGWPRELDEPSWATAAGLAMYSARLKLKGEWKRKAPGLIGLALK